MRCTLIVSAVVLMNVLAAGCEEQPDATLAKGSGPASAPERDVQFFRDRGATELAHFRVRWTAKTVGQRTDAQGYRMDVKEYLNSVPVTADFYVEPGAERLTIAQDTQGKVIALYLKNLRIVAGCAEADVYGLANNFGFCGPPGSRVGAGHQVSRHGTQEEPKTTRFAVGRPVDGQLGWLGTSARDGAMGADYSVITRQHYAIELVRIPTLSEVLEDDKALDNVVPAAVQEEAKRDTQPTSRPAAR